MLRPLHIVATLHTAKNVWTSIDYYLPAFGNFMKSITGKFPFLSINDKVHFCRDREQLILISFGALLGA